MLTKNSKPSRRLHSIAETPEVVSNTMLLDGLGKISKLWILRELYGKVYVPTIVLDELRESRARGQIEESDWILVLMPNESQLAAAKRMAHDLLEKFEELDKENAFIIALAKACGAKKFLTNDRAGVEAARSISLKPIWISGIILEAYQKHIIKNVKPILDELRTSGVWISDQVYQRVLEKAK